MSNKEDLLMHSLSTFFSTPKNINTMLPVIHQKSNISLRLLDWFVTNYSKKNKTNYKLPNNETFNVHLNYKSQLKSYSKKQFDPFCRRNRIKFYYNNTDFVETTVGQLCFFRWSIQNKILDHVKINFDNIENDMTISLKQNKQKQNSNEKTKRSPLSVNASKTYTKTYEKILITFD
jgi:hypothetical protein